MNYLPAIADDEFRLIKITEVDPVVTCVVEVFKFELAERQPEPGVLYYALSYAWGDEGPMSGIFIDGHAFGVTLICTVASINCIAMQNIAIHGTGSTRYVLIRPTKTKSPRKLDPCIASTAAPKLP